jgi:predicted component of type VI protein secretion system
MTQALERILLHHLEGSRQGEVDSFVQPVVSVGRAPDSHLVLAADKGVSSRHCEIRQDAGQFEVVDNNSTNGLFVNEERVTRQALSNGDTIRFGWLGPMVKVEFEAAVRAMHPAHPVDDAQSTVMVSARRIQQAAEALGEAAPAVAPKSPQITMPPPSRAPAAPPPVAAPPQRATPAAAPAPPPPVAARPSRPAKAPGAGWSKQEWVVVLSLVSVGAALLAVGVWLLLR